MQAERRRFLQGCAAAACAAGAPVALGRNNDAAAARPSAAERSQMAGAVTAFMNAYDVPGFGFAIAREGRLVHEEAYGVADRVARTPLTTSHRFRIASISKPVTSAAIFKLVEQGKVSIADRVFGPAGILGEDYGPAPAGSPLRDITVEHLLTHTCGGWPNGPEDPMWRRPGLDQAALIAWTLKSRPLDQAPGSAFAYSNFGYCLLGRVIEKTTRQPYADFVQAAILAPAGATGMEIAGNTLAERRPDEVRYHGSPKDDPYALNVRRMDAHGGWIARPAALAAFASSLGGASGRPLLQRRSVEAMTTPSRANPRYAKGWRVNPQGNWWHTGHLPGTCGLLVRTRRQLCWAALLNTRQRDDQMDHDLDRLMWTVVRGVKAWNA